MSSQSPPLAGKRTKLFAGLGVSVLVVLIVAGVFAKNGWFPSSRPDPFTGKRTGWFGRELSRNESSGWNPVAPPVPDPTPQLSKSYIYAAGSKLVAVEDANASAPSCRSCGMAGCVRVWHVVRAWFCADNVYVGCLR
jgi:hypothetical protein